LYAHASLVSLIVLDRSCLTPTAAPQGERCLAAAESCQF
jgi:hypothetical protein